MKRKNIANRLLGSLFSVSTITGQLTLVVQFSGNLVPRLFHLPARVWERLHVSRCDLLGQFPLQFDFRASPGSLFLLKSHCRGFHLNKNVWALHTATEGHDPESPQWQRDQSFFSTPSECLQRPGSVRDDFAGTIGRIARQTWPSWAAKLNFSSRLGK